MNKLLSNNIVLSVLIAILCGLILSSATPSSIDSTGGVAYFIPVIFSSYYASHRAVMITAVACIFLSLVGLSISVGDISPSLVFEHRSLAILVILSTAWIVIGKLNSDKKLKTLGDKKKNIFEHIVNTTSTLQSYLDKNLIFQEVNNSYLAAVGKTREELIGQTLAENYDKETYEKGLKPSLERALAGESMYKELWLDSLSGEKRCMHIHADPHLDEDGSVVGIALTSTDITKRKKAEAEQIRLGEELYQAQKLESLGQLAAGIAHEINTPCQYISDNTTYLADAIAKMEPFMGEIPKLLEIAQQSGSQAEASDIERIRKLYQAADIEFLLKEAASAADQSQSGMEKIKRIVSAMKEFAHPVDEGVLADINEMLANTLIVARNEWKNVAELVTDYDEALPDVYCIPSTINQVFLNIIVNAAHAMADVVVDGELDKLTVSTSLEDDQAIIKITDTGPGMTDDVRKRIFDPFFTTKEIGAGTGNGLAISHKIIREDHKGSIEVESTPGEGSCFTIRLPINQK